MSRRYRKESDTDQHRTSSPEAAERLAPRFSWQIAALLLGAAGLWVAVVLPGELRFVEESKSFEALVERVVVVPKRTVLTVTVPDGAHVRTHTISASSFRQWEVGDRVRVLIHPQEVRVDSLLGRHPLSLPGIGGIGFLALILVFAERTVAVRRKKEAAQTW